MLALYMLEQRSLKLEPFNQWNKPASPKLADAGREPSLFLLVPLSSKLLPSPSLASLLGNESQSTSENIPSLIYDAFQLF